jgi:hypothetical protein
VEFDGHYYLFIEQQFNRKKGTLGYVELFDDLSVSGFTSILEKDYHLSFPNIFRAEVDGKETWCMIPETNEHGEIDLYTTDSFPGGWLLHSTLMKGVQAVDTCVFKHDGLWWLFAGLATEDADVNQSLSVFCSETFPSESWKAIPDNPVVRDSGNSRMAGSIFFSEERGSYVRPAQNCAREYGKSINFNRIIELTPNTYREETVCSVLPEKERHTVCTHTWNRCGKYVIRDIKTRRFRL